MNEQPSREFADVPCLGCSCLCDDLTVRVEGHAVAQLDPACPLAERWFAVPADDAFPTSLLRGQPTEFEECVAAAAAILRRARWPLVFGLADTNWEAQRAAVALADRLGAVIDTPTSSTHGPTLFSFPDVGESTCTLGEVRERADFVLFWNIDPTATHPRFVERYLPRDPAALRVVVAEESHARKGALLPPRVREGGSRSETGEGCPDAAEKPTPGLRPPSPKGRGVSSHDCGLAAEQRLTIRPGSSFTCFWTLRAILRGLPLKAKQVERQTGVRLSDWQALVERMVSSHYGTILTGDGRHGPLPHLASDALGALVRELNARARFVTMALRSTRAGLSADQVLTWQTGYPFAVSLAQGYPQFGPGEFSAAAVLGRGEADAALIVGPAALDVLPAKAVAHLAQIPHIVLAGNESPLVQRADVAFRTARPGVGTAGRVHRLDDVPLPLRSVVETSLPSDAAVLAALEQALAASA